MTLFPPSFVRPYAAGFGFAPPLLPAQLHAADVSLCPARRARAGARPMTMLAGASRGRRAPTTENRIARNRYDFLETHECGIELLGSEIKAVRDGKLNIRQGYARIKNGEMFLHNVHISHWTSASAFFNHDPLRVRRLLLHKRQIRKLAGAQVNPGLTIVPVRAYFNKRGFLKVEIALARGKKLHDKREDIKKRESDRDMKRVIKATLGA